MNDSANILFYAIALILPLSALIARRVPLGSTMKMAAAWLGIFIVGLLIVSQYDRVAPYVQRTGGFLLGTGQSIVGDTVRLPMAEDGHFYAQVALNGIERRMLIDSGATTTALSATTARAAGIDLDANALPAIVTTANGEVAAQRARVARLALGPITAQDLPVIVSDSFGDMDVIGMNFLSRLASWRVEGRTLILEPYEPTDKP